MSEKEIFLIHKKICYLIAENKLADAFLLTGNILEELKNSILLQEYNKQKETYNFLLEYSLKGIEDPEKMTVYNSIRKRLITIADSVKSEYLKKFVLTNKLSVQQNLLHKQMTDNKISISTELKDLAESNLLSEIEERKIKLNKLFFLIWLTDILTEEDYSVIKKYAASKKIYPHEMSVIVSALTISLLRHFDKRKFHALFHIYDGDKTTVWNRALVGIILSFYYYDKRIPLYPDLLSSLNSIKNDDKLAEYTEHVIYQIVRSKETEKLSKRLQDEVIPEMQKIRPKIQDKLNLDDILSDGLIEDSNPDWEELFDDTPELLDKMADFSKLQLEGSDVFMSAFANFKNFPFFNHVANWFIPFYAENADIKNIFSHFGDDFNSDTFIKGLERSPFMCNSDKYSFCFNIGMMPEVQRKMIVELFKQEQKQTEEIVNEDKLLNKNSDDKQIFTRYIQDLYRFFKLHPWKNDITDIFSTDLDIHNTNLYRILIDDENVLIKIAEMYFKKEFFTDASEIYETLSFKGNNEAKRYEKIGFCYQKMKNFEKALENYKKAEIIKEPSLWLTKKLAFCYRKLNNFEKAKEYYLLAEKEDEENMHIQANIGHCLLELGDFENALKKYFKVEYYNPDNKSVMRPLAWCSFLVGKLDTANSYYQKLTDENPTAYDFINFGHLFFAKGEKLKAVEMYIKAVKLSDIKIIEDAIREDVEVLMKYQNNKNDIDFLIDYVKTKIL